MLNVEKHKLQIGITGGIGAGKSFICKLFGSLQIPIYDADTRAKTIMVTSPDLVKVIIAKFGGEAYNNGELQRQVLANQVFNNPDKLAELNALVHPAVFEDYRQWVLTNQLAPYLIKEAALMFESDSYKMLDAVITVTAPTETKIDRVLVRDTQRTKAQVLAIISNQLSDPEKIKRSQYVIKNGNNDLLAPQIIKLHLQFLQLAKGL